MARVLGNFHYALLIGVVLLIAAMFGLHGDAIGQGGYINFWLRFLHVISGVLWIGLLYYFNFVQIPTMPKIPAELKPAISKHIAPAALFWFRWAALATVITGLLVAETTAGGYIVAALALADGYRTIGVGMWLALVMAANVWFVIWPNQKRALGIVPAEEDVKARSATTAMMASRTNLILSIPMLYLMVTQVYLGSY
jgi:uncharacterized membrane protein